MLQGHALVPAQTDTFRSGLLGGMLSNLALLVERLDIKVQAQAPQQWLQHRLSQYIQPKPAVTSAQQAKKTIQHWVKKHVAVVSGEQLKTVVTFQKGRLQINGKPFSVNMLSI
jgi:hypothetical protein